MPPGEARVAVLRVRVKSSALPRIDAVAARRNMTRSAWVRKVILEALGPEGTPR
jgi:hypothetical protein